MDIVSQSEAILTLKKLASEDKHSILIEGAAGCGKTYLAHHYATLLNRNDIVVQSIAPTVNDIKTAVDSCLIIQTPVLLCIENLDTGVPAAAYALLKFLEEPTSHVYIIVTCRNIKHVPDTIISRSAVVNVSPPIAVDIENYAKLKDAYRYERCKDSTPWKCVSTFSDVDYVLKLTPEQVNYFEANIPALMSFKDSVSNMSWAICHFTDNTEIPAEFSIKLMLKLSSNSHVRSSCIDALKAISLSRVGLHAILCKLLFECKYGGG